MNVVAAPVIWNGSQKEGMRLVAAISHNCECQTLPEQKRCAAHEAFAHDQNFLDHMVYLSVIRKKLIAEEQSQ